jgi:hypothetical protein
VVATEITDAIAVGAVLLFAVLDIVVIGLNVRTLSVARFSALKGWIIVTAAIFWFSVWAAVLHWFWVPVYRYVFPENLKAGLPWLFGLAYAGISALSWLIAVRFGRRAVLVFCLQGGFWGAASHLIAVARGIVENPPMLQQLSPASAVAIAFFEFIFYWGIILVLARAGQRLWSRAGRGRSV